MQSPSAHFAPCTESRLTPEDSKHLFFSLRSSPHLADAVSEKPTFRVPRTANRRLRELSQIVIKVSLQQCPNHILAAPKW
jgi:hypothetical protein